MGAQGSRPGRGGNSGGGGGGVVETSYYELLEVEEEATADEIKVCPKVSFVRLSTLTSF
jgi:hypothetical protein